MQEGYIKLFRCIQDNVFWDKDPFSRGQAWIDLIMLANHKPGAVRKRGILVKIDRGQVGWSERELAKRWKWSRGKVFRFLNDLKNEQQIEQQNGPQNINVTSLITIINYDKYQSDEPQNEPQNGPQTGHKRATNSTMNKNEKNEKNKDFKTSSLFFENPKNEGQEQTEEKEFFRTKKGKKLLGKRLDTFIMFWEAFNYKKGKAEAADAWLEIPELTDSIVTRIVAAAKAEALNRGQLIIEGKTPKMAQGWISGRRWEDETAQRPNLQLVKPTIITDEQLATIERQRALIYGNS